MNIAGLIKKGRLVPIVGADEDGVKWITGYKRKDTSRKSSQQFTLKKPIRLTPVADAEAAVDAPKAPAE